MWSFVSRESFEKNKNKNSFFLLCLLVEFFVSYKCLFSSFFLDGKLILTWRNMISMTHTNQFLFSKNGPKSTGFEKYPQF
jgi:hypothetical protein